MRDAAAEVKARLREDLRTAMKSGRTLEVRVIRALVAALDNAEAPPAARPSGAYTQHRFDSGSAEVERLLLAADRVQCVLSAEIDEREHSATDLEQRGAAERAAELREEVLVVRRYRA